MSFLGPLDPTGGGASDELVHDHRQELERKAERYAKLHAENDNPEPKPGIIARILNRLRRRSRG